MSFDNLKIEQVFKVHLGHGEKITCGFYSENDINFSFGTSHGNVYLGSLKAITKTRVVANFVKLENIGRHNNPIFSKRNSQEGINIDLMNDNESIDIDRVNSQEDLGFYTGVTSIHFPFVDPIGTMLVAFDDGTIKLWQSSVKNETQMKILELEQAHKKKVPNQPVVYDIAEIGYQQFDLIDNFDIFENPHGLEDMTEDDRN